VASIPAPSPAALLPRATAWLRDDRYSPLMAVSMWVLIVLMIVPEGFDYDALAMVGTGSPTSGGAISRALWLGLLLLAAFVICWRAGLAWLLARALNPYLLLFVALAVASVA
jgi:hypothetical protein